MTIGMLFWLLMILALVFGVWRGFVDQTNRYGWGMSFFLWFLLFLLGWRTFGFILQG